MSAGSRGRRIRRALLSPLALVTYAAVLIALVVWFLGPLIAFGEIRPLGEVEVRLGLLLLIVLLWGIAAAILQSARGASDDKLVEALRRQNDEAAAASEKEQGSVEAEVAAIRRQADLALRRLGRTERWDLLRPRSYRLPWYLVIGPENSGKTSAILNSGLDLPYAAADEAVQPTANCEFVLANQAIFLDTSGRFVGAMAERSVERQVWFRLLRLIRRYRPLQPLAGVFVVVSGPELVGMAEEARYQLGQSLRRRLDDVSERLRSRPPVYVIVSKLDGLPGFEAFFDTLAREEREQVWGVPIALPEAGRAAAADPLGDGFRDLLARLASRQTQRLQEEPDVHRRSLIFEFPSQIAGLKADLAALVATLSAPHRFAGPPLVRALFLTSTRQDGASVDVLGRPLARSYAQPGEVLALREGEGGRRRTRSFFLKRLFLDLVFPEAGVSGLAGPTRASFLARAALLAVLGIVVLALLATGWSNYRAGVAYAQTVEDGSADLRLRLADAGLDKGASADLPTVLPVLDRMADLDALGETRSDGPILSTRPIEVATRRAYRAGLQRLLLPHVMERLETDLRQPETPAALLFEELKLYLILTREHQGVAERLPDLGAALSEAWLGEGATSARRAMFARHIVELATSDFAAKPLDRALVDAARRRITETTIASLAYDLVRASAAIQALPPWRPSDHMSAAGPTVLARNSGRSLWDGVPGLFTREAFFATVLPQFDRVAADLADDAWVLGPGEAARPRGERIGRFRAGALDLFLADDIRLWDNFLSDLSVVPFENPAQAAEGISILLDTPSPAAELVAAVAAETNLDRSLPGGALGVGAVAQASARLPAGGAGLVRGPGAPVTDHFDPVRRAVSPGGDGKQPSQYELVLKTFEPLYRQLNHVAAGGQVSELATSLPPVLDQIAEATKTLPATLQPLFVRLRKAAADVANGTSRSNLKQIWASTVLPACRAATAQRFPFDPRAKDDTPLGDFAGLFSPTGQIAAFRDKFLAPFIDTTGKPWKWRSGGGVDLKLDLKTLAAFEHADAITQAFFPGGKGPATQFQLEAAALDPAARSVRFDVGGAALSFAHGPASPLFTQWPPAQAGAPAALTISPEIDGGQNMIVGQGDWALFRVVSQARKLQLVDGNAILATFDLGGRRAVFKFTPSTARNPFEFGLLDSFKCPELK